jgi:hypothetical protein
MIGDHMKYLTALAIASILTACSTPAIQTSVKTSIQKVHGLLEVRISGDGENATASARFIHPGARAGALRAQAITVLDDVGLKFKRRAVNFIDTDDAGQRNRNTQAVFDIENTTPTGFSNLTLYALNVPNVTIGGTSVSSMTAANGSSITDEAVARSMKPSHGMQEIASGLEVVSDLADLQLVQPSEASDVQTQAAALPNSITGNVLEYGFVARNATDPTSRLIGQGDGIECPAILNFQNSLCKGMVTLAYSFPVPASTPSTPSSARLWAFNLYFLVADQEEEIHSQSLEEQNTGTISGVGVTEFSGTTRALFGTTLTPGAGVEILCRVKTALPTVSSPTTVFLGAALGTSGCP